MQRRFVAAAVILLVPLGILAAAAQRSQRLADRVVQPAMTDLANRDIQIAAWKKALAADSASAIALGQLAGLYMQRARESGGESNYVEAERYASRSVDIRANRNGSTFLTLASVLLAQHRFVEARTVASRLVELEPDIPQYRAMLGEIELELGNYDAARGHFDSLSASSASLSVAPRLARWMEINGRVNETRHLLASALADARQRKELPREQLAWFHLRLGDVQARSGRMHSARASLEAGLEIQPDDYRLLSAMSRLEANAGNPRGAIEYGERATAIKLDPATLGTVGDAYAALGDSTRAEDYFRTMEVAVAGQTGAYHRAWSLFLLDHNRRIDEVLANVTSEMETRKDVYGHDLLAWALHKSGRNHEARKAIGLALGMGTRDAMLFYHAGMIEHALGQDTNAREFLETALAINDRFDPAQPNEARAVLASIED